MAGFHFICYSHLDGAQYAERLERELESGTPSIKTWRDRHELIAGAGRWTEGVSTALRDCDSLIFLMTPDSVRENSECWPEWNCVAVRYMKPVILLRMDPDARAYRTDLDQQIHFNGDFSKLVAEVQASLAYAFSQAGMLTRCRRQLEETRRSLSVSKDERLRDRLAARVKELQIQVTVLQAAVEDPATAQLAAQTRIASAMEGDRRELLRTAPSQAMRAVNSPPLRPPRHFRGRTQEAERLKSWVLDPACRIITLHGRGGGGKSTLACQVIQEIQEFGDRADLAAPKVVYLGSSTRAMNFLNLLTDLSRLLPSERCALLEKRCADPMLGADAKMAALLDEFATDRAVVLLDSFNEILNPATFAIGDPEFKSALETLLGHHDHGVTLLLTTRFLPSDLLKFSAGRQERWELNPGLPRADGIQVLRELDADGSLGVRDADEKLLEEGWRRTGGNPRALEQLVGLLAANPDNMLSELLEDLPEDLTRVLVGEVYAGLDPMTQAVLQAMSICATSWFPRVSAAAVDFLLHPHFPGLISKPILGQLVRLYLTRRDQSSGAYALDPIDAEYARSRIPRGEAGADGADGKPIFTQVSLRRRAIDYYTQLFKLETEWKSKDDLRPQLAAFELCCAAGEYNRASDLLAKFDTSCLLPWGHDRLVADLREGLRGRLGETRIVRYNETVLGICYCNMGYLAKSVECHEMALTLAREGGNEGAIALGLGCLGDCYRAMGLAKKGAALIEEVLASARTGGDHTAVGRHLTNLGICQLDLGDVSAAVNSFRESAQIAVEKAQVRQQTNRYANLALALLEAGDLPQALATATQGAQLAVQCDQPHFRVAAMSALALVQLAAGRLPEARAAAESALRDDVCMTNHAVQTLFGIIALLNGDRPAAANAFHKALQQADEAASRDPRAFGALDAKGVALCGLALIEGAQHLAAAETAFRAARALTSDRGVVARIRRLLNALAPLDEAKVLASTSNAAIPFEPTPPSNASQRIDATPIPKKKPTRSNVARPARDLIARRVPARAEKKKN